MENKTNIPKLRFPEFSGEWEEKKLGEITKYTKGFAFKASDYISSGIRIIRVSDLTSDAIKKDNEKIYIEKKQADKFNRYKIVNGDIIITTVGSKPDMIESAVGRGIYINDEEVGLLNQNMLKFEKVRDINNKFLLGCINSKKYQHYIKDIARGNANQSNITVEDLLNYKLYITSSAEQQKIASFLSAVDKKLEQLQQKKKLLEQYKKGMMQKLFSQELRFKDDNGNDFPEWEEKQLGDIAFTTTGSSNRQDSNLDGKYTFFDRSEDIRTSNIYLFDGEAIIVAGEGQQFKPKYFIGKFDLHQRTYAIMNFEKNIGKFLFYYIEHHTHYFYSKAVGSTVKSLRLPIFNKMPIMLPINKERTKIADFLTAIDNKIEVTAKELEGTKNFKKGLLQQMFV